MLLARGVGHTLAMLEGAKNTPAVVIVGHTHAYAQQLAKRCKGALGVGLEEIDRLRGMARPVVFDHMAVEVLFERQQAAEMHVMKLSQEVAYLTQRNIGDPRP